jgi:hypothetical protein
MRNQVKKLHNLGVSAVSLLGGMESDEGAKALEWKKGNILYYMAQAESLLKTERAMESDECLIINNKLYNKMHGLCFGY